ncbi:hypothetical protein BJ742DRAFT_740501 [Cladochytrium replicatum]|nr:hypothetical protein BJ742DRAFT_740501 [Cladochytrium replicatum]
MNGSSRLVHLVRVDDVTHNNTRQLKTVLEKSLSESYQKYADEIGASEHSSPFYTQAVSDASAHELAKLGYFNDVCVGGIVATRKALAEGNAKEVKYGVCILGLGVLRTYRRYGVARALLESIAAQAANDKKSVEVDIAVPALTSGDAEERNALVQLLRELGYAKRDSKPGFNVKGWDADGSLDFYVKEIVR